MRTLRSRGLGNPTLGSTPCLGEEGWPVHETAFGGIATPPRSAHQARAKPGRVGGGDCRGMEAIEVREGGQMGKVWRGARRATQDV